MAARKCIWIAGKMLTEIRISNYAIVDELEFSLSKGLTVITGETGAGKSIALDALGLCLGDRADSVAVRAGSEKTEINATFSIKKIPMARTWLQDRDLSSGDECLLRRVVTREGRSKAYINGSLSTLKDCAELGSMLIDVHSQHEHQSLLRQDVQRNLLDDFGGHCDLASRVSNLATEWHKTHQKRDRLVADQDSLSGRMQLLSYQLDELNTLALAPGELKSLELEAKRFQNAEEILESGQEAISLVEQGEEAATKALRLLGEEIHDQKTLENVRELVDSARISFNEALSDIKTYIEGVEFNPAKQTDIGNRLEKIYSLARKHKVMPEKINSLHSQKTKELDDIEKSNEAVSVLDEKLSVLAKEYQILAAELSKKRSDAARDLEEKTESILSSLAMQKCQITISLTKRKSEEPHPSGLEEIRIMVSTNPGNPQQPISKIASGGELSRISLAIRVATANTSQIPSIIFDEIDSGIGGAVAQTVGKLLKQLAEQCQILCVTHLPQVAAFGHSHLIALKSESKDSVKASISTLSESEKVDEIARMLAGEEISDSAVAHARAMIRTAQS